MNSEIEMRVKVGNVSRLVIEVIRKFEGGMRKIFLFRSNANLILKPIERYISNVFDWYRFSSNDLLLYIKN